MNITSIQSYNNTPVSNKYKNQKTYYNYKYNVNQNASPSFGDAPKGLTNFVHDHFTVPVMKLGAKIFKNPNENLLNHMQTLRSAIISGVYMYRTLNNDQLEETKKKTLAVNQFLTFVAATAIGYCLDSALNKMSEGISFNYADKKLKLALEANKDDKVFARAVEELETSKKVYNSSYDFFKDLKKSKTNNDVKAALEKFKKSINIAEAENKINVTLNKLVTDAKEQTDVKKLKKSVKEEFEKSIFKPSQASDFIEDFVKSLSKDHSISDLKKYKEFFGTMKNNLVGVGVLKKIAIFTTVYRLISPIAVTPIANMLGNKMFEKKEKQ